MKDFKEEIAKSIAAVSDIKQEELQNMLEIPKDEKMGDYALPCFRFAKILKKAPAEIAEELKEKIQYARNEYRNDTNCRRIFKFYNKKTSTSRNCFRKN